MLTVAEVLKESAKSKIIDAARLAGIEGLPYSEVSALIRSAWADGILSASGGNEAKAAREGGIHRNTLHRMLQGKE
jgi:hypothetical protein